MNRARSAEYRKKAAENLRAARRVNGTQAGRDHIGKANGFKALAAAEEWIAGQPQRSFWSVPAVVLPFRSAL